VTSYLTVTQPILIESSTHRNYRVFIHYALAKYQ